MEYDDYLSINNLIKFVRNNTNLPIEQVSVSKEDEIIHYVMEPFSKELQLEEIHDIEKLFASRGESENRAENIDLTTSSEQENSVGPLKQQLFLTYLDKLLLPDNNEALLAQIKDFVKTEVDAFGIDDYFLIYKKSFTQIIGLIINKKEFYDNYLKLDASNYQLDDNELKQYLQDVINSFNAKATDMTNIITTEEIQNKLEEILFKQIKEKLHKIGIDALLLKYFNQIIEKARSSLDLKHQFKLLNYYNNVIIKKVSDKFIEINANKLFENVRTDIAEELKTKLSHNVDEELFIRYKNEVITNFQLLQNSSAKNGSWNIISNFKNNILIDLKEKLKQTLEIFKHIGSMSKNKKEFMINDFIKIMAEFQEILEIKKLPDVEIFKHIMEGLENSQRELTNNKNERNKNSEKDKDEL